MTTTISKSDLSALCRSAALARGEDYDLSPILRVRHGGAGFTLAASDGIRLELLSKLRDGETVELEVDIRAFLQQDGISNRNFLRFKKPILRKLAKSFKGVPLLRDHDSGSLEARAGTITESAAVKVEGGFAFDQTARITAPWAVEALLAGNLDRFSIGWDFPGLDTLECSSCKCAAFGGDCPHFPGDKLEDGGRAEFVFTEAEGVEVSAVSVPAVKGTGLDQIRSALAAGKLQINKRVGSAEDQIMKSIAKTLGLQEDADESTISAALSALRARAESAETSLASERVDHTNTRGELSELSARVEELDAQGRDREIDSLCTEFAGSFPPNRDSEGELSLDPGPLETQIRELAAKDIGAARAMLEAMPSQLPELGATPRSIATVASTPAPVVPLSAHGTSELAKRQRAQLGISEEDFAKYNSLDGTETAHLRDSN
jgi:phage head maturation protease